MPECSKCYFDKMKIKILRTWYLMKTIKTDIFLMETSKMYNQKIDKL